MLVSHYVEFDRKQKRLLRLREAMLLRLLHCSPKMLEVYTTVMNIRRTVQQSHLVVQLDPVAILLYTVEAHQLAQYDFLLLLHNCHALIKWQIVRSQVEIYRLVVSQW